MKVHPSGLLALLGLMLALTPALADKNIDKIKLTADEKAVLDLVNKERAKAELPPLKFNPHLTVAARNHSANMAKQGKLDHDLDGTTPSDRAVAAGYGSKFVGENIANGVRLTPAKAVELWMNSKPHRENILNKDYDEIGIGIARTPKGDVYYTKVFGKDQPDKLNADPAELEKTFVKASEEILRLTNEARAKENLPPLTMNETLVKAALAHSQNQAKQQKMAHVLDGKQPHERVKEAGYVYRSVGENVAYSDKLDVAAVFQGWMNSKGHRENILKDKYTEIGIAIARAADGKVYYTQVFGTPAN